MSRNGWVLLVCFFFTVIDALGAGRGVVIVRDGAGRAMELYDGSYALLIGISDYTAGWPDLDSIPGELRRVEGLLEADGFQVVKRADLDGQQLRDAFQEFIDLYGYNPNNRLLFYFSGHGHTWMEGGQGYLVARDAPRPASPKGFPGAPFLRKTLQMSQILAWSRQLAAKHALFLFDSCFSGTLFQTKALPEYPPHISRATALKVRQFITAGSAGEQVPARSVFTPAFVDALEYGWGDLNGDGYVTGMELGLYLESKVPQHARQSPQFGKHPDYDLSRGDFVFALAPEAMSDTTTQQTPASNPRVEEAAPNLTQSQRRRLQRALNERGFEAGSADGVLGTRSRQALASYQRSEGLEPTGYLTAGQWARLQASPPRQTSKPPSGPSDLEPDRENKAEREERRPLDAPTFMAENVKKKGVMTTGSGLQYKILRQGTGKSPSPTDMITMNYRCTLIDGEEVDNSYKRGKPANFKVNQIVKGMQEGVQLMKESAKWILYIPPELGYGARGAGPIPPNSVLIFEVELLSVN